MKRPSAKSVSLTKVSKAIRLPSHPLSNRLRNMLEMVDAVHSPENLKAVLVIMDRRVAGGLFYAHAETGPYDIYLDPEGSHPELSLLHEIGHFLEWQCIPKNQHGSRDFNSDALFGEWLDIVLVSSNVQRMILLRDKKNEESKVVSEMSYRNARKPPSFKYGDISASSFLRRHIVALRTLSSFRI
jgi:hypothetical protein